MFFEVRLDAFFFSKDTFIPSMSRSFPAPTKPKGHPAWDTIPEPISLVLFLYKKKKKSPKG